MLLFESDTGYKKICIWQDSVPFIINSQEDMNLVKDASQNEWYNGTICIEARINPRHISNYAFICMKYTKENGGKSNIRINFAEDHAFFKSKVLPFDKMVKIGLEQEYAEAIKEFFEESTDIKLPSGRIEIQGGFDEVGSSNVAFKKVMQLLVYLFENINQVDDDTLKKELLNLI